MDFAYKSDRGANVFFNPNDKKLNSNTYPQQSDATETPSQNSVKSFSDESISILSNGTYNAVKTPSENNVYSETLHGEQMLMTDTNANISFNANGPKCLLSECSTLDQRLDESTEPIKLSCKIKKDTISDEAIKKINDSFSSSEFESVINQVTDKDEIVKAVSVSDIAPENSPDLEFCVNEDVCVRDENSSQSNSEKVEFVSPIIFDDLNSGIEPNKLVHKVVSQSSLNTSVSQSDSEIFSEVDELADTDQESPDLANCHPIICNSLGSESTKLDIEDSEVSLQPNNCETSENFNDTLSEEEVYEEVEDDEDEENILEEEVNEESRPEISADFVESTETSISYPIVSESHSPLCNPSEDVSDILSNCCNISELSDGKHKDAAESIPLNENVGVENDKVLNENRNSLISAKEFKLIKDLVTRDEVLDDNLNVSKSTGSCTEAPCQSNDGIEINAETVSAAKSNSSGVASLDVSCCRLKDFTCEMKSDGYNNTEKSGFDSKADNEVIISEKEHSTEEFDEKEIRDNQGKDVNLTEPTKDIEEVECKLKAAELKEATDELMTDVNLAGCKKNHEISEDELNVTVLHDITDVSVTEHKNMQENSEGNAEHALIESEPDDITTLKDDSLNLDDSAKSSQPSDSELLILDEVGDSDEDDGGNNFPTNDSDEQIFVSVNETKISSPNMEEKGGLAGEKVESPKDSSEGDDFDLDDAIKDFAIEEKSKVVKLSDDELDSLVEEFVEAECSKEIEAPVAKKTTTVLPDSDDEFEMLIENFKATDSDDDCFIVDDVDKNVVIDVEQEKGSIKEKKSNYNQIINLDCEETDNQILNVKPATDTKTSENISSDCPALENKLAVKDQSESQDRTKTFPNGQKRKFSEIANDVQIEKCTVSNNSNTISETINSENSSLTDLEANTPLNGRDSGAFRDMPAVCISADIKSGAIADNGSSQIECNFNLDEAGISKESHCPNSMDTQSAQIRNDSVKLKKSVSSEKTGISLQDITDSEYSDESVDMDEIIIDMPSKGNMVTSLDTESDSKKRKIAEVDGSTSDANFKKLKESDESPVCEDVVLDSEAVESRVKENVEEFVPKKDSCMFKTKKKWLDKIAMHLCSKTIEELFTKECSQRKETIKELEQKILTLDEELLLFQSKASDLVSAQQEAFQKHGFNPQVPTRTVGVNVKIFRECDLQPIPATIQSVPLSSPVKPKSILRPNKETPPVQSQKPPATAVPKQVLLPTFVPNTNMSGMVTSAQNVRHMPPNITMAGTPLLSALGSTTINPRPLTPRPKAPVFKDGKQVIDLTEEASNARRVSSSVVTVPPSAIPKVNLPGMTNNQNVLVPLSNLLQMLPPSTQNNTQLSMANPLQVTRQTLVPQGLLGPRTVAYIMPSNNGHINTIGGRGGLPFQPFLPGSNQRVQTIVVARVTNPGTVPPINNFVSSSARLQVPQQQLPCSTRTVPSAVASAGGLVLFPRAAKHPAPFPPVPSYPTGSKSWKALPPKPSLKGSRAPHGIILSWNMSLHAAHADVSNYQLFAYQETNGPVSSSLWKKVGDVKALPLPMACTLTQFVEGNRYFFTVRAVDAYRRYGPYSDAVSILYGPQDNKATGK